MDAGLLATLLIVVALIVAIVVWRIVLEKRRVQELEKVAAGLGFHFSRHDSFDLRVRYPVHSLFQRGDSKRYAYNVMDGDLDGRRIYCFDYHYVTESVDSRGRRSTTSWYFSCVLMDIGLPLPNLFIRPEGFLDKLAAMVGFGDIEFESAEFNKKFLVKSSDKKFAYDVIHPRAMEYLLAHSLSYTMELGGRSIIRYKSGKLKPEEIVSMIDDLKGFVRLFPEYLRRELKGGQN